MGPGDWIAAAGLVLGAVGTLLKGVSMIVASMKQDIASAKTGVEGVVGDMRLLREGVEQLREGQQKSELALERVWKKFDEHQTMLHSHDVQLAKAAVREEERSRAQC